MTPCLGAPDHPECRTCQRYALRAIMRPVVKLTRCAMYVPAPTRQRIDLVPYAGKEAR